jgi:hypothetical protein
VIVLTGRYGIVSVLENKVTVVIRDKNLCVWVKDNGGMGSLYRSQHELVFVFKHGRSGHRNNVQLGQYGRNRSNVWRYPGANSFARGGQEGNLLALHPTVKISARATRPTPPARSPGWRAWRSVFTLMSVPIVYERF